MTGTSLDGIDCALVDMEGQGSELRARFVQGYSGSLGSVRDQLRALAEQQPMTAGAIARLAREFALLHARACEQLLAACAPGTRPDFVCVHGQTVFHEPPASWQLFEPAPLAHALGVPVVCNLRQADLAAGGQGAPITPIADAVLFGGSGAQAIINLGGFCNVTVLHQSEPVLSVRGYDVCACNHVLDAVARLALGTPFDEDGRAALRGTIVPALRDALLTLLRAQRAQHRSLGTGDELMHTLRSLAAQHTGDTLAASACDALARAIVEALPEGTRSVLVAGGGTRNAALLQGLRTRLTRCDTTDAAGVPTEFREAACFAVLGALCADGVSIYGKTWPAQGGAIAGCWAGMRGGL
jgi:1,6-anhydro-N-acetylmuramate kinase